MNSWKSIKQYGDIKKTGTQSAFIRFQRSESNGKKYIDVREHFSRKDGSEQYTVKGFSVAVEDFGDFMSLARDVWEDIREEAGSKNGT